MSTDDRLTRLDGAITKARIRVWTEIGSWAEETEAYALPERRAPATAAVDALLDRYAHLVGLRAAVDALTAAGCGRWCDCLECQNEYETRAGCGVIREGVTHWCAAHRLLREKYAEIDVATQARAAGAI